MSPRIAGIALVLLAISGCASDRRVGPASEAFDKLDVANQASAPLAARVAGEAGASLEPPADAQTRPPTTSMLIRTGQASIEVDSLEVAVDAVSRLAVSMGGYLTNSIVMTGAADQRRATLEVRVPSDRYDGAMSRLAGIGKLRSSSTSSQDVGEEYVDLEARVGNARRLEERLVTMLATRTGKLEEALAVERELARVRESIERLEGRLRYLSARVAESTITIELYEPAPLVGNPGSNVMVEALRQSWRNFVEVTAAGIAMLGGLLPVALVLGLVGFGVRRRWQRRRTAEAAA
ncbi:MAG: DUF4349 domain-containing protein [Gemmatimonadales bacterium]